MRAAAALLLLVLVTHYGYEWPAAHAAAPEKAASWWFYILRGAEGAALFVLLLNRLPAGRAAALIWVAACAVGAYEEAQTAACGLAALPDKPVVPLGSGLCIETVGWMPYGVALIAMIVYIITIGRGRAKR